MACIQTMTAIPDLVQYLNQKLQLSYILPGKFTSDPIEGQFGWYRQANGGNFYMSIRGGVLEDVLGLEDVLEDTI